MKSIDQYLFPRLRGFSAKVQHYAQSSKPSLSMPKMHVFAPLAVSLGLFTVSAIPAHAGNPLPTNVVVTAYPANAPVGTPITLVANVYFDNSAAMLNSSVVDFCDDAAASCNGSARLAETEITNNQSGTSANAVLRLGIGSHQILVVYRGTTADQQSANVITVNVTGKQATSTTIAATGTPGNYELNSTVTAVGRNAAKVRQLCVEFFGRVHGNGQPLTPLHS